MGHFNIFSVRALIMSTDQGSFEVAQEDLVAFFFSGGHYNLTYNQVLDALALYSAVGSGAIPVPGQEVWEPDGRDPVVQYNALVAEYPQVFADAKAWALKADPVLFWSYEQK